MNTKGSVIVSFFCFLTLFTLTDCRTCQINVLEGNSVKFKLVDRPLKDDDRFTIKKDNTVVVPKRTRIQKGPGTVTNDYLELQVKLSDSGTYTVEAFDKGGIKLKSESVAVCVYAKVPKPRVNITCQIEKQNADFRCDAEGDKDLAFSWYKNGKELKNSKLNTITNVELDESEYTCTVWNPVHNNTSEAVKASCPKTLFGFDLWVMVAVLAGGGALVLLLTICLVTLACRSCKRKEKHQRDEEEFRLNYVNASQSPVKAKQTARGQPAPPEPIENGSGQDIAQAPCQTAPRPRNQQRARPPPPPTDDEEENPPPLPQPRKKAQLKKREGP